jgi:hypothetical protein
MKSREEFLELARQCMLSAENTKDDIHQEAMLDLAKVWSRAALNPEGGIALIRVTSPAPDC